MTLLGQLPARMDRLESQIVQFRAEIRADFSAVHQDMQAGDEKTIATLRDEIRAVDESLREEIHQARRETRVLHEEVISRIALLGESFAGNGRLLQARRRRRRPDRSQRLPVPHSSR